MSVIVEKRAAVEKSQAMFDPAVILDEPTHTYRQGEKTLPSVTQVLRFIDELDGIPRDVLDAAARFGQHVHLACHLYNQRRLNEATLDSALAPYLAGYKKFLRDTRATIIDSERLVHHRQLGYAGKLDLIARWEGAGELSALLDIKSSAAVPRSVGAQTAGYWGALPNAPAAQRLSRTRYCLHLKGDGTYRLHPLRNYWADWSLFLSCLNVWKFLHVR